MSSVNGLVQCTISQIAICGSFQWRRFHAKAIAFVKNSSWRDDGVWNFEDGQAVLRVRTELMNALLPLILLY